MKKPFEENCMYRATQVCSAMVIVMQDKEALKRAAAKQWGVGVAVQVVTLDPYHTELFKEVIRT